MVYFFLILPYSIKDYLLSFVLLLRSSLQFLRMSFLSFFQQREMDANTFMAFDPAAAAAAEQAAMEEVEEDAPDAPAKQRRLDGKSH